MKEGAKSRATVKITVEVLLTQPWSSEATIGQIWEEGKREAVQLLTNALQSHSEIRIASNPVVTAILSGEKE